MVGAADCRSAGPWFNSGWKSWFTFLTGHDKLTNQIIQMFNNMSPIRTVMTTITRKSVNTQPKKTGGARALGPDLSLRAGLPGDCGVQ